MDNKHLERIFTIFQRLHTDKIMKEQESDSQLQKKLIQQHGRNIWAESEQENVLYF